MEGRDRISSERFRRAVDALSERAREALAHFARDEQISPDPRDPAPDVCAEGTEDSRSLADEVREVQEGRRRRAESAAIRSSEDIEDVLSRTYAAAAERRAEERAEYLLDSDPIEETPLGVDSSDGGPSIEVRRRN